MRDPSRESKLLLLPLRMLTSATIRSPSACPGHCLVSDCASQAENKMEENVFCRQAEAGHGTVRPSRGMYRR